MQTVTLPADALLLPGANSLTPVCVHNPEIACLSLAMIDTTLPGEPEGISTAERHAVYAEMSEIPKLMDEAEKVKTDSSGILVVGFALIASISACVTINSFGKSKFVIPEHPVWLSILIAITSIISTFLAIMYSRKAKRRDRIDNAVKMISKSNWRTVFLKAMSGAEFIVMDPATSLKTVRRNIYLEGGKLNQLPMNDIVGMVRLAAAMRKASDDKQELRIKSYPLNVSNENSELLSRVCGALANKTPDEIMSDMDAPLAI